MINLGWSLVWTIINLIVLYLLLKKFLIGPVLEIMEKRKTMIAQQFEDARTVQQEAQALKGHYEGALASVKEESAQMIEEAKADAKNVRERLVKDANEQAARIIQAAKTTAEQEKRNALQGARTEIAGLAMEAARKMLEDGSSEDANQALYDRFLAKAGDAHDTDSK